MPCVSNSATTFGSMIPKEPTAHAPSCASTAMCLLSGDQTAAPGQWRLFSARLTLTVLPVVTGFPRCQGNHPCQAAPTTASNTTAVSAISNAGTRRRFRHTTGLLVGEIGGDAAAEVSTPVSSRMVAIRWPRALLSSSDDPVGDCESCLLMPSCKLLVRRNHSSVAIVYAPDDTTSQQNGVEGPSTQSSWVVTDVLVVRACLHRAIMSGVKHHRGQEKPPNSFFETLGRRLVSSVSSGWDGRLSSNSCLR